MSEASATSKPTTEEQEDTNADNNNNNKNNDNDEDPKQQQQQQVKIPFKFVPKPFPYHSEVTIQIESLSDMGWGQGTVVVVDDDDDDDATNTHNKNINIDDIPKNWQIRVPLVLPNEIVKVRIFKNMDTYSEGDLISVTKSSPYRVEPKCPIAGKCGGCQFQHMHIKKQREWKTDFVLRGLLQQQINGYTTKEQILNILHPATGTDEIYEYRSKITPHYNAPIKVSNGRGHDDDEKEDKAKEEETYEIAAIGFQQFFSRQLIDVEECPIATNAINIKYKETRNLLHEQAKQGLLNNKKKRKKTRRRSRNKGETGATLLFRQADDDPVSGNPVVTTDNNEYITTTIKGIKFKYQAGNFFQNNDYVTPLMVDAVLDAAIAPIKKLSLPAAAAAEDNNNNKDLNEEEEAAAKATTTTSTTTTPTHLIDCYCGSGLFALNAASKLDLVVGIEVQEKAVQEATDNAKTNSIENCQFVAASAEAIFISPPAITIKGYEQVKVQDFPRDKTVVVLDPPRKGCSGTFLEQLYQYSPQRIVYMSCGPTTQARDAKGIVEIGGYEIVSIQPFDLFPQTKHIECLIVFEKTKEGNAKGNKEDNKTCTDGGDESKVKANAKEDDDVKMEAAAAKQL